ncbi:unnamed protein product [Caenorhabditis angaria]|uniref:Serpentine Receptor, class T n=1 Tax=Caenorhabditis angaria TaxID=860376 RepID=A0A9P1IYC4_9PELO|nr:unnamed protein product [Caenorhabditis angaria]
MSKDFEMSLFFVITHGFILNQDYYNCTDPEAIQGTRIKWPYLGWYFIISGGFFIILFIPCIIVGLRSELIKSSCYKIMFLSSSFDILQLIAGSLATGFYGIQGSNFCDFPKSIFSLGAIGCGAWFGGCISCVTLAINRCCDIDPNLKLRWIFNGNKVYVPLFLIMFYASCGALFTKPPLFRSDYMSWFFDPRVNNHPEFYTNMLFTMNNCLVSIFTTSCYVYLCILLRYKSRHSTNSNVINKTQKQVFLQSVIICSFNAVAAYTYVYMQYFYTPPVAIILGHITWQLSNGSVSIVYLTLNGTIKRGVYKMIIPKKFQKVTMVHNSVSRMMTRSTVDVIVRF